MFDFDLFTRLFNYNVTGSENELSFVQRLANENMWDLEYAQRVYAEYLLFCYLAVKSGHAVTPSVDVDQCWHLHMLYTRTYWDEFCPIVLGRELHHGPTKGGLEEKEKFEVLYEKTKESYEREFDTKPPEDIWPPTKIRFSTRLVTIDLSKHLIVNRSKHPFLSKLFHKLLYIFR